MIRSERVLSLDVSSKTGWAILVSSAEGFVLEAYGQEKQIPEPPGEYPVNYVDWARTIFAKLLFLVETHKPDVLVIEETASGSKSIYSQKILEYIHYLLASLIKDTGIKAIYMMTEVWRREVGCVMSDEEKKKNKLVRDYKKKVEKETGTKPNAAYDINGKRVGLTGRKHVNVRRANEEFGKFLAAPLRKKDEDTADSLLLALAYHNRRMKFV